MRCEEARHTDEFVRVYQVRGPQLMWLLGAGASANAGAPTAADMILEFKALLYASRERVSLVQIGDLADPRTRAMLQQSFMRASVDSEVLICASMFWNGFERTMLSRIRRQPLATQFFRACGRLMLAQKLRGRSQAEAQLRRRREVYLCRSADPAG